MKKRDPVIAIAQIKYFENSEKNNVAKIREFIIQAKQKKADIICFPESCVHKTKTLHFGHYLIEEIKNACNENKIWAIIDNEISVSGKTYNTALLIGRDGKIKGKYHKIKLYGDGDILSGRQVKVFDTDFGKVGIAICWDLAFPELFKKMKKAGAEIVFCPAQWRYEIRAHGKKQYTPEQKSKEKMLLRSLLMTRAFENLFYIALCNPLIDDKDMVSYSAIAAPHKILDEISGREGMIIEKISLEKIKKWEKIYDPEKII